MGFTYHVFAGELTEPQVAGSIPVAGSRLRSNGANQ